MRREDYDKFYTVLMDYSGVIIEESLGNKHVLKSIHIVNTRIEIVTERHKTSWVKQWTIHTVQIPESKGNEIAKKISKSLDKNHYWYADFKNNKYHYIIYYKKIFKVDLKNPILYEIVKYYGVSLGIPKYQVAFET